MLLILNLSVALIPSIFSISCSTALLSMNAPAVAVSETMMIIHSVTENLRKRAENSIMIRIKLYQAVFLSLFNTQMIPLMAFSSDLINRKGDPGRFNSSLSSGDNCLLLYFHLKGMHTQAMASLLFVVVFDPFIKEFEEAINIFIGFP